LLCAHPASARTAQAAIDASADFSIMSPS
jgi:hypothetical protein